MSAPKDPKDLDDRATLFLDLFTTEADYVDLFSRARRVDDEEETLRRLLRVLTADSRVDVDSVLSKVFTSRRNE